MIWQTGILGIARSGATNKNFARPTIMAKGWEGFCFKFLLISEWFGKTKMLGGVGGTSNPQGSKDIWTRTRLGKISLGHQPSAKPGYASTPLPIAIYLYWLCIFTTDLGNLTRVSTWFLFFLWFTSNYVCLLLNRKIFNDFKNLSRILNNPYDFQLKN